VPPIIEAVANRHDLMVTMPMVMLTLFACGILIIDLLLPAEDKGWNAVTAGLGLFFSAFALVRVQRSMPDAGGLTAFSGTVLMNGMAIFFCWLFLVAAAITILMSLKYLEIEKEDHGEYYALILFSVVGMMCMAAGADLVLLFIGLELMAISTYILVGFLRTDKRSNEAALKYLLLGAFSSGIFAYGLSLIYGLTGSTNLFLITQQLSRIMAQDGANAVLVLAVVATFAGLFFKIAAVPFHQWAPDAYEGAPTAITGFMSVASKAAAWALLLRIVIYGLAPTVSIWKPMVIFVAIATLTGGNLAAMTQNNLKRLLAYSSIAHVGYMLFGIVAWNADGIKGILIYLLVYTFMNLGAFAVIVSLRRRQIIGDEIDDIRGLFFKQPVEAILMLLFLLSLAGIPPLAGFYGKYFIFLSLIETGHYALASLAVFYVAVSLYYYLRIVNPMFMQQALDVEPVKPAFGLRLALIVTGIGTVGIGLFPEIFIQAANWSLGIRQVVEQAMLR
jgi:NADH-quinone oxidoreductase subunit N